MANLFYHKLIGDVPDNDRHVIASTISALQLYRDGQITRTDLLARVTSEEETAVTTLLDKFDTWAVDEKDRALSAWDRLVRGAEHGRVAENPVISSADQLQALMESWTP